MPALGSTVRVSSLQPLQLERESRSLEVSVPEEELSRQVFPGAELVSTSAPVWLLAVPPLTVKEDVDWTAQCVLAGELNCLGKKWPLAVFLGSN